MNIIIVEDQKMFRDFFIDSIEKSDNIQVIGQAENGVQLLKLLETKIPDVILLDIEMPEMNGSETLNILKRVFPKIKVIIVSQYDDETLIMELFNRGINAYVPKDTDPRITVEAIHAVHMNGVYKDNLAELLESARAPKGEPYKLKYTKREREIIQLLCKGCQVSDIASHLSISVKTIETFLTEIYKKAGVTNRSEFLIYAIKEGLNYLGKS